MAVNQGGTPDPEDKFRRAITELGVSAQPATIRRPSVTNKRRLHS